MTEPLTQDGHPVREPDYWMTHTVWLTRDRLNGELADIVEVWRVRPELHGGENGDVTWLAPDEMMDPYGPHARVAVWSVAQAKLFAAGAPDSERECVRCGDEPAPAPVVD